MKEDQNNIKGCQESYVPTPIIRNNYINSNENSSKSTRKNFYINNAFSLSDKNTLKNIENIGYFYILVEYMKAYHIVLNLFYKKSLQVPFYRRFLLLFFYFSLNCFFNCLFISNEKIDQMFDYNKNNKFLTSTGFLYTLNNFYDIYFLSIVCSGGCIFVIKLIFRLCVLSPEKELNNVLKTKNKEEISKAK